MDRTSKGLKENELAISPRGKNLKRRECRSFGGAYEAVEGLNLAETTLTRNSATAEHRSSGQVRNVARSWRDPARDARKNSSNDRTILRYSKTTLFSTTALNFIQRRSGE